MSVFRPSSKKPGLYYNDGQMQFSIQSDGTKPVSAKLLAAIAAAKAAFWAVYNPPSDGEQTPRDEAAE